MKIILSRKGFDSGYGGCASPIFEDNSMASFPIPWGTANHDISEVNCGNCNLGAVVESLTRRRLPKNKINSTTKIHLDPDLSPPKMNCPQDWRQAFGQDGRAQTHLDNQLVGIGDLFLFFGWFRKVERTAWQGRVQWDFVPGAPDIHVIFGWLQVGAILKVGSNPARGSYPPWMKHHPHIEDAQGGPHFPSNNTIYVASDKLVVDGMKPGHGGGGAFGDFKLSRQLTHPAMSGRSTWRLPRWFGPSGPNRTNTLSYHTDPRRWTFQDTEPSHVNLRAVDIGQEFVMNVDQHGSQATNWLLDQIFV